MQGDDGLAGAGSARDERGAAAGRSDRGVLFGLDGRDDVAHPAGALAAERGHERTVADHRQAVGRVLVQQVVDDLLDAATEGSDDAAAGHLLAVDRGGAVERRGGEGPPVDQERPVLLVADAEAADVADPAVVEVEAAEDQSLVLGVEVGDAAGGPVDEHVALVLGAGDGGAAVRVALVAVVLGLGSQHVDAVVDAVDVVLLEVHFLLGGVGGVGGGYGVRRVDVLRVFDVDGTWRIGHGAPRSNSGTQPIARGGPRRLRIHRYVRPAHCLDIHTVSAPSNSAKP
ncbi:hypothetical protein GCM10029992_67200 [Glycomyces albus]